MTSESSPEVVKDPVFTMFAPSPPSTARESFPAVVTMPALLSVRLLPTSIVAASGPVDFRIVPDDWVMLAPSPSSMMAWPPGSAGSVVPTPAPPVITTVTLLAVGATTPGAKMPPPEQVTVVPSTTLPGVQVEDWAALTDAIRTSAVDERYFMEIVPG